MPDEETLPVEEITEEIQTEPTTPEVTEVLEPTTPEVPADFDWSQFENTDRFQGRTVQEVVNYLNDLDRKYGSQTRELGDLRSYREQSEAQQRQATGQPAPAKKPSFTDGQKYEFARKFTDAPLGAVSEMMGPQLAEQVAPLVLEQVREQLGPAMQKHSQHVATQAEYDACVRSHPELQTDPEIRHITSELMGPDYLNGAPFEQAYLLAKLSKDEPSLFGNTCYFMRQRIPYDRAKRLAELELNAPANAEAKNQQLKDEVKGIGRGRKTSTKTAQTEEPEILDMDDAFDAD